MQYILLFDPCAFHECLNEGTKVKFGSRLTYCPGVMMEKLQLALATALCALNYSFDTHSVDINMGMMTIESLE